MRLAAGSDPYEGHLPIGCQQCLRGEKMVVFVTGVCAKKCFYCPLSQRRKMNDPPFANERELNLDKEGISGLIEEAKRMSAKGAGVTGGDPLIRMGRTIRFVRALKRTFGKDFHIHMYTTGELGTPEKFKRLYEAGVDEIRFHFNRKEILDALKLPWVVGGEIPAIPGNWKRTVSYLEFLWKKGAKFCNLNELDWSEQNVTAFKKRGFKLKSRESYAVEGSEEMAVKLVKYAKKNFPGMTVHYCSSRTKDAVQVRKRYVRTAKNIRKPFERIDSDGLLVKGAVLGERTIPSVPKKEQFYNKRKNRVEVSVSVAEKLSRIPDYKGKVVIVSEQPTVDAVDLEVERV